MQSVDNIFRIVLDNVRVRKDRDPIILPAFRCFDAIHAEATGKASYTAKDGFERLSKVVRDEVSCDGQ